MFFPIVSHLMVVIFSAPHHKYCLERGFWSIPWSFPPSANTDWSHSHKICVTLLPTTPGQLS